MKIDMKGPSKQLRHLRYIMEWLPSTGNGAKNPYDDAVWKARKIRELLADDKDQCEALKRLMDSEISIKPRVKNLPKLERLYKLMKQDHVRMEKSYGRMLSKLKEVCNIWNEINIIDGHMYAATTDDPSKFKLFEKGIESDKWVVVDYERGKACLAMLNNDDYHQYLLKCYARHPKCGGNGVELQPNQPYRMLTYVGNTKSGNRPLFLVVYIEHSSGDFESDMKKLPHTWVPLYVNVLPMSKH